ncbi:MAG: T9SS type A sorting domain-containing protein, partial [Bacteroidota bacterium]|nr:T9SS type A sorting domain-containing protein [Bacteroidota bacterium]
TGTYNVLITDANGCTITGSYTLTEPVALSLTSTITNVSVLWGSDGAIDIEVAGGILPYSYAWSNSAVSEDLLNIIAGVYTVTVTDDNGCLLIESFEINQPPDNPGWTYTNTGINHTILIPSTATLVVEGAPLIPGDYIGVFYDSLGTLACGGLIEYTGLTTALPAWGVQALNDGFVTGEEFTWKIWKAIENMEYEVNAIYMPIGSPQITHEQYFAPNGQSGITALEDVEARQEIELMAGWNIISSYVIEEYMALDSLFADIVSNVGLMKDENGQAYWPGYGVNLIGNWVSEEGYRIYMLDIDTLKLAGEEVDPTTTAINLPFGWSYIGYILDAPGDPAVMLNSVISNIDLLKDENGHVYWPIFGFNSIGNMMPDEGFAIFANAATSFFYPVTPVSGTKSFNADIESKHYGTAFNTGNNMTLGIPVSAWETVPAYGDEVSVFSASGQLVGSAVFANTLMAITVWGDNDQTPTIDGLTDNESLIVKIWNQSERTEQILNIDWVQGSPNYETDDIAIAGKVSIIESFTNSLGQNMPNPVNTLSEIEYSLAKDANVEISVYNILGDKLEVIVSKSQSAGTYKVQFDASNYAAGTYFYKLRAGDFSAIKKMNIVR